MANLFNSVPVQAPARNKFNLSFSNKFTANQGIIYPCLVQECLPGDKFKITPQVFVRTMPLVAPAFADVDIDIRFFFVPNRLIFKEWENFIVRGKDGKTDYIKPFISVKTLMQDFNADSLLNGGLLDYLGFPPRADNVADQKDYNLDMLPVNAYNKVYNDYFRDENLIPEVFIWDSQGQQTNITNYTSYVQEENANSNWTDSQFNPFILRRSAFRHDYFTSALPSILRGEEISVIANDITIPNATLVRGITAPGYSPIEGSFLQYMPYQPGGYLSNIGVDDDNLGAGAVPFNLYVDQTSLQQTAITIDQLRTAVAITQFMEFNKLFGDSRYIEFLLANFAVRSKDYRLQRSEYLGGDSCRLQISDIPQTSATNEYSPQGSLAGKGTAFTANETINYFVPEHGFILGVFRIIPRPNYYLGLPRKYQRWDSYDYYVPAFDHLSEQAINYSELDLHHSLVAGIADETFGYTPRFSEYRTNLNEVHGLFRGDLSYWVQNRRFPYNPPKLDYHFIEVYATEQRLNDIFSYIGENDAVPHFYCIIDFNISAIRPMSLYAVPKF